MPPLVLMAERTRENLRKLSLPVHECHTKRRRVSSQCCSNQSRWSTLPSELLELVLSKLCFVDILRFKATCSSWLSVAELYSSSSSYKPLSEPPWLMVPCDEEDGPGCSCFFNLADKKVYKVKNADRELPGEDAWCVGSSHGWLVLLDNAANPFLFNPFSRAHIKLPLMKTFPSFLSYNPCCVMEFRKHFIDKVILLSDPSRYKNFAAVAIFGLSSTLAFCNNGDKSWTKLEGANLSYSDIISHRNSLYALTEHGSIEVWDFNGSSSSSSLTKTTSIEPAPSPKMAEARDSYSDLYFNRCYLVESSDDLLLVVRFIGNFVDEEGKPVTEAELLSDEEPHPLFCPYRTLMFHVYKLDFCQPRWTEVENIGDQALFLGGNHSLSVSVRDFPECEANSVYFTDDNWEQMNEDYMYGGHDHGVFSLRERTIKPFYPFHSTRIQPPPFWVLPNPW